MTEYIHRRGVAALVLGAALIAGACGTERKENDESRGASHEAEHSQAGSAPATGRTIVVEAYSDANGNYFKPSEIEAKRGDVIRFVLKSGAHNVHFLPDSNPGKAGLPPASDVLQIPDQTYELPVTLAEGHYYFQCDPHAALGMTGHLEVDE